jgi:putative copper export protein
MPLDNGRHMLMVITRAVHIGALILPTGSFAFLLLIAGPAVGGPGEGTLAGFPSFCARLSRWNAGSLAVAFISGLAWLGLVAVDMSGLPLSQALSSEILGMVLRGTGFGQLWGLRLALTALLFVGMLLFSDVRSWKDHMRSSRHLSALVAACFILGSIAWIGHSAAVGGDFWLFHFFADALHLVAAGFWLGSLPGLAFLLRQTLNQPDPL